jgi:hypothetical protein
VTFAIHVTSGIPRSTSPLGDIIVPHHFDSLGFRTLGVSILAHFQFSQTLISQTGQTATMCLPYRMAHINPRLRDFGSYHCKDKCLPFLQAFGLWKTQTSTFSEMFLSKSCDLPMCVSHGSMAIISSGLWISKISTFNLHFSPKWVDFCRVSSSIRQLRITLVLHPKSTDLCHVSSRSDGLDSPWVIRHLRFTSALWISRL